MLVLVDENVSKMDKLEELRQSIADGYTKLRNLGDKWDNASKKYLEKTEEFSPLHIKVSDLYFPSKYTT